MALERRATTQDISWFLDLYRNNQLNLAPVYQRRSVWSPSDRRFFLDTIFRGYPSPAIFLHKYIEEGRTMYAVVDGKQRLETIIQFAENKLAIDKKYGDSRLEGKKWRDVEQDPELVKQFWDYVLLVEMINIQESSTFVNNVFERLNRNSRKLVEQELRHAKYDGWFISFVERESEEPAWTELKVVTASRGKRMRDVQFLSELLIVLLKGANSGFDQEEIDSFYAKYDDLQEAEVEIDESEIKERFVFARDFLVEMQRTNGCITHSASDYKDVYTLWALVVLNKNGLPGAADFARAYEAFMSEVLRYRDEDFLQRIISGSTAPTFKQSYSYFANSTGPNTELPQRQARYDALLSALLPEAK